MALWDILGKSLNAPVHQLLGGRRHDKMPAYASGGWKPTAEVGAELKSYIDRGNFKAVKMRVGSGDGTLAHSIERVHAARDYLGPDVALMCDAHGTFTVSEAKRFCRSVADCNIDWLEEPVTADDKRGQAEVRASTDIPISCGESEFTRFAFRDLAELRAADIFQPDLSIAGGITEAMRIEAIAAAYQIRFAPHLWGGALCFASGLHVLASGNQRLHRGIFAGREPDAARAGRGGLHRGRRLSGNSRPPWLGCNRQPGIRGEIPGQRLVKDAGSVSSVHHQDRTPGDLKNVLGNAAQNHLAQAGMAIGTHHD